ncbi:hypothetical protein J1605_000018 [Eschrichtius robustus]|uniref:Trichoplein keratin filament-binding protein n=1 Tax=Eschrichtius robustus TaxID=9764 RepID=A0AB34I760_ESCRO|nr:hypothetical protein J1605_000018 [Eschrichtius robustus]
MQQEAAEEEKEKRYENEYETARREALERMKAEEERRQLEGKLQADALRQQMEELKVKEMEATKLKKEQENLLKQRWELERLEEERKQMAALWQKAELGRFLRHQYNVQLNRRTQQIQEELEADRRILQALLEEEDENQRAHLARREQAQADVAWMKRVIEEQLQLERAREAELQMLLREEAKEMWEKREAEWARERSARDRLMSEVLTGRRQQIQEKIEQNRREQEESLRHREQLIRDLEEARESAHREKEESEELKSARKQELEAQVAERQLQAWEADQQEEEEEEEARQAEQLTDALLRQEAKMMAEQGYRPKVGSRRGWRYCCAAQPGPALPGSLTAQGAGLLPSSSAGPLWRSNREAGSSVVRNSGKLMKQSSLMDIPESLGTDSVGTVNTESKVGEASDVPPPDRFTCSVPAFGPL